MKKVKPSVATILRNMGMKDAQCVPQNRVKQVAKKKSKAKTASSSEVATINEWEYVFKHPTMAAFKLGKEKTLEEHDVTSQGFTVGWSEKAINNAVNIDANTDAGEKEIQTFIILGAIRSFNYDFNASLILIADAVGVQAEQTVSQENASGVITRKREDKNCWEVRVTSGTFSGGSVNVNTDSDSPTTTDVRFEVPLKKLKNFRTVNEMWDASTLPKFTGDQRMFLNKVKCHAEMIRFKSQQTDTQISVDKLKKYIQTANTIMKTIMPMGENSVPVKAHLLPKDHIYVPVLFIALFFKLTAKQKGQIEKFKEGARGRTPAQMFGNLDYVKDDANANKVHLLLCVLAYAVHAINKGRNDTIQFDGDFLERFIETLVVLKAQLNDILMLDEEVKNLCKIGLITQDPEEEQIRSGSQECGVRVFKWGKKVIIPEEGQTWEETGIGQLIKSTENDRKFFRLWMDKSKPVIGGSELKGALDFHNIHEDSHPWNILKSNLKTAIDSLATPVPPAKKIDPINESLRLLPLNSRNEPHLLLTARDNNMYIRWTKQCICSKCEKPIPLGEIHTLFNGMSYDYYDACDNQENSSESNGSLSIHYATDKGKKIRLEIAAPTDESAGTSFKLQGLRDVESATWVVVRHVCNMSEGDSERYFTREEIDANNHVEKLKSDLKELKAQLEEANAASPSASDSMLRTLQEEIQQAEQTLASAHANAVFSIGKKMACGCEISQQGTFENIANMPWKRQAKRIMNDYILPSAEKSLPGICNLTSSEMKLPNTTCASIATKDDFCPNGRTFDDSKSKTECAGPVCQPENDADTCCSSNSIGNL